MDRQSQYVFKYQVNSRQNAFASLCHRITIFFNFRYLS